MLYIIIGILIGFIPTGIYFRNKVHYMLERLADKDAIISVLKKHIEKPVSSKKGRKVK
jgi:hypothetical protein